MHRRTHMAQLTKEQSQTRFLAIVLPLLTLCTHTLLALSSILPGSDPDRAVFSFIYNVLAGGASTLGLAGAIRLLPQLISIYTFVHTTTLAFATIALFSTPFDFQPVNPVVPSWHMNENAVCEDIDASFGWDQEWLDKCSRSFSVIKWCIACIGLMLMVAQWWALFMVKSWGTELRPSRCERDPDVEKNTVLHDNDLVDFK